MAVLVNFKICDNAEVCSGIAVCPADAIFWNGERKTLDADNVKCNSCGLCESACPAGAIVVVSNDEEYRRSKKRIEDDPRTIEGLFVERYGASPIDEAIQIDVAAIGELIKNESGIVAVEVIDDSDTACLINSVPVAELFSNKQYIYRKIDIKDEGYAVFAKKYGISEVPSLLIFKDANQLHMTIGVVENNITEEREAFINSISSII